ncbi:energy-coupling factor transporter transmembrane component T family protein [Aureibacillus halotolerans]|uniref:Energy-coupling factor transport system permease protein n=1 Tax=Aureibacillus halotolerans TaxID=1508390 RepID=A0A4V3D5R6_9BACI|nr:energy-coupling factor transporter transmembrane component T [Aureibacillus halotolerans]TDQ41117.1 energy-coupling factor transport system permease protein [Aureibacillus halotolerans]
MSSLQQLFSKLSVETIKIELMRTAYGNERTLLSRLDPRMLMIWVLVFSVLPWLTHNLTILVGLTLMMAILTYTTKVSPLLIVLFFFGVISQFTYIVFAALFLGNSFMAAVAIIPLTLKVSIVSLCSMAVFTSMDPEKFSDGLVSLGVPGRFSFGVSYGYRMLPMLIEEFQNIIHSFRLRGKQPEKPGVLYTRYILYYAKMCVMAFYPMMLNMAKRTRTTVEALEIRGFSYTQESKEAKKLKLAYMKITRLDIQFLCMTILITGGVYAVGVWFPYYL